MACGDRSVPIELSVKKSSFSSQIYIELMAPIRHNEFYLLGAQYNIGNNTIPMYRGYRESENIVSYEANGSDDFFKDSVISISYSIEGTLCTHSEEFHWGSFMDACKNCEEPNK